MPENVAHGGVRHVSQIFSTVEFVYRFIIAYVQLESEARYYPVLTYYSSQLRDCHQENR